MIRSSFRAVGTVHLILDCAAFFVLALVVSFYTITRRVLAVVIAAPNLLLLAMPASTPKETTKRKSTLMDLFRPKKAQQQQAQDEEQNNGIDGDEEIVTTEQKEQPPRGESPVSLSFPSSPEATAPDETEDELVTLRSRVRELEVELQETQHVLRSTRQALVLKTEQFHRAAALADEAAAKLQALCTLVDNLGSVNDALAIKQLAHSSAINPYEE